MKKSHFESMDHEYAKNVLADRLRKEWLRVDVERPLYSWVGIFIPDVAVYDEDGLAGIYEVVMTHDIDLKKMNKIWTYAHDMFRPIFLRTIEVKSVLDNKEVYMLNVVL